MVLTMISQLFEAANLDGMEQLWATLIESDPDTQLLEAVSQTLRRTLEVHLRRIVAGAVTVDGKPLMQNGLARDVTSGDMGIDSNTVPW